MVKNRGVQAVKSIAQLHTAARSKGLKLSPWFLKACALQPTGHPHV